MRARGGIYPHHDRAHLSVFLRRQRILILVFTLLAFLVGILYVVQQEPRYTARGRLLGQEPLATTSTVDVAMIDSQVEIIRSDTIALKVIEALKLSDDPKASRTPRWRAMLAWMAPGLRNPPPTHRALLPTFAKNLSVKRVGLSAVIEVGYRTENPDLAARIVNQVMQTYLSEQAAVTAAAQASGNAWLHERVADLFSKSRTVSVAEPPIERDDAGPILMLAAFTALGFLLGIGVGVARQILDTTLREPAAVRAILGGKYLGAVAGLGRPHRRSNFPPFELAQVAHSLSASIPSAASVVAVRSILPGEGVTVITAGLASAAAADGQRRVLLIDCNAENPKLSRRLAAHVTKGLHEVVEGSASLEEALLEAGAPSALEVILAEPLGRRAQALEQKPVGSSSIDFLPIGSSAISSWPDLWSRVAAWTEKYDLIVLDMPPFVVAPEACGDGGPECLLLVVEWGRVPASLAAHGCAQGWFDQGNFLGFVLNKVRPSQVDSAEFPVECYRWGRIA